MQQISCPTKPLLKQPCIRVMKVIRAHISRNTVIPCHHALSGDLHTHLVEHTLTEEAHNSKHVCPPAQPCSTTKATTATAPTSCDAASFLPGLAQLFACLTCPISMPLLALHTAASRHLRASSASNPSSKARRRAALNPTHNLQPCLHACTQHPPSQAYALDPPSLCKPRVGPPPLLLGVGSQVLLSDLLKGILCTRQVRCLGCICWHLRDLHLLGLAP
mmetsp:Transcript_15503/g.38610  ORF Transcript_15503/g.38610 Transcript_15503/m.38610 type:complete len:219 (-) Transcript_15503:79-735(-)